MSARAADETRGRRAGALRPGLLLVALGVAALLGVSACTGPGLEPPASDSSGGRGPDGAGGAGGTSGGVGGTAGTGGGAGVPSTGGTGGTDGDTVDAGVDDAGYEDDAGDELGRGP